MTLTTITDRVYLADGTPAEGSITITWPEYVGVDGDPIAAGDLRVQLRGGHLRAELAPCAAPTYYTASYHLAGGQCRQVERWRVPSSSGPLRVHDVRLSPPYAT